MKIKATKSWWINSHKIFRLHLSERGQNGTSWKCESHESTHTLNYCNVKPNKHENIIFLSNLQPKKKLPSATSRLCGDCGRFGNADRVCMSLSSLLKASNLDVLSTIPAIKYVIIKYFKLFKLILLFLPFYCLNFSLDNLNMHFARLSLLRFSLTHQNMVRDSVNWEDALHRQCRCRHRVHLNDIASALPL